MMKNCAVSTASGSSLTLGAIQLWHSQRGKGVTKFWEILQMDTYSFWGGEGIFLSNYFFVCFFFCFFVVFNCYTASWKVFFSYIQIFYRGLECKMAFNKSRLFPDSFLHKSSYYISILISLLGDINKMFWTSSAGFNC